MGNDSATTTQALITESQPSKGLEPWIVGVIVGGALTALAVVGVAVFVMLKRKEQAGAEPRENLSSEGAPPPHSKYANYGLVPVAAPKIYTDGRIDLDAESAESESLEQAVAPNRQYATVLPSADDLYKV
jgi:hypothetical protein